MWWSWVDIKELSGEKGQGPTAIYLLLSEARYKSGDDYGCTITYGTGRVTGIISSQSIPVDDIPCYVKDLHPLCGSTISTSSKVEK